MPESEPTGPVSRPARSGSWLLHSRLDAATPVFQRVQERLLEGDLRLPAQGLANLGGVAEEMGHVGGTEARRILFHLDARDSGPLEIEVENLPDGPAPARAEIVNLAAFLIIPVLLLSASS